MSGNDIRWIQRFNNFTRALGQLSKFIQKGDLNELKNRIDHKIVWFGSINLLSFGHSEESIMRLVSNSIAYELSNTINALAKDE